MVCKFHLSEDVIFWKTLQWISEHISCCLSPAPRQLHSLQLQSYEVHFHGPHTQSSITGVFLVLIKKAMATHSSTLTWRIPWTEEPSGLQSMGSLRVGHDWATSLFTFMNWRRKWQPTPVFLAWRIPGTVSLMGCHLWGRTESDTTEAT